MNQDYIMACFLLMYLFLGNNEKIGVVEGPFNLPDTIEGLRESDHFLLDSQHILNIMKLN